MPTIRNTATSHNHVNSKLNKEIPYKSLPHHYNIHKLQKKFNCEDINHKLTAIISLSFPLRSSIFFFPESLFPENPDKMDKRVKKIK